MAKCFCGNTGLYRVGQGVFCHKHKRTALHKTKRMSLILELRSRDIQEMKKNFDYLSLGNNKGPSIGRRKNRS